MPPTSSPDDICLWPDGTWCRVYELPDYSYKSDDYSVIPTAEEDAFFFGCELFRYSPLSSFCSPSATSTVASLPASATGQGEGTL